MKMKHSPRILVSSEEEKDDRKMVNESLLLPSTSIGRTTSSTMCERSNVWAENKLAEKKHSLDTQLYRSVIKMNVDKLEIVDELAKLKKSASTGALDAMARKKHIAHLQLTKSHLTNAHIIGSQTDPTKKKHIPTKLGVKDHSKRAEVKDDSHKPGKRSVKIIIGGDSSDSSDGEVFTEANNRTRPTHSVQTNHSSQTGHNDSSASKEHACRCRENGNHATSATKRILSVTSCPSGRECSSSRSELQKFENATRRYAKVTTTTKTKQVK